MSLYTLSLYQYLSLYYQPSKILTMHLFTQKVGTKNLCVSVWVCVYVRENIYVYVRVFVCEV